MITTAFAPHDDLAKWLLPHATEGNDGSHDAAHILRVFKNAMRIHAVEGGDSQVLAAAVLLHDCVSMEKNAPNRADASRLAAKKAEAILADDRQWPTSSIQSVSHAILTHSFSANLAPETLEAKSCKMPTGWMPSEWSGQRVVFILPGGSAPAFTIQPIRRLCIAHWTTSALPSTIFRPSFSSWRMASDPDRATYGARAPCPPTGNFQRFS